MHPLKLIPVSLLITALTLAACSPAAPPTAAAAAAPDMTTDAPQATPTVTEAIVAGEVAVPVGLENVPGPVRECIEAELGPDTWNPISSGQRTPDDFELSVINACLAQESPPEGGPGGPPGGEPPPLDLDSPLPEGPGGEMITAALGPVTLETYSPATITSLENSTNLYIYAHNTGDGEVTVLGPRGMDIPVTILVAGPLGPKHFFDLNPYPTPIAPGETAVFEFILTGGGEGEQVEMVFSFTLIETGEQASLTLRVVSSDTGGPAIAQLPEHTAAIQGHVTTSDGEPLAGTEITVYTFNNIYDWRSRTDQEGYYYIPIPSTEDLQAALGERPLPYYSLGYTVIAAPEGYTIGYRDEIELVRGATPAVDFTLEPVALRDYNLVGELTTDGPHGYWWLLPDPAFNRIAAVQARHPPETGAPGHIIMIDLAGNELWRLPTTTECWGFDVSAVGDVAAGCHDGTVYLADAEGNLRWQVDSGGMNRWVQFSPDGSLLLTGPYAGSDIVLLDVATGQPLWRYGDGLGWLRNAIWSPDGERVLTGHAGGALVALTRSGEFLWQTSIGEFPMVLEMDADYNTTMAGKSRELFSFDAEGELRWRRRIGTHVVTAGADSMSADGSLIAVGTVSAWVQTYDSSGDLLWQQRLPGNLQGHNALDMTPDGEFIVVGSAGEAGFDGYVTLYDRDGAVLWQTQSPDLRDQGTVSYAYEYDHNHRGAITVAVSDDARYIVAGYGDSTLRIFEAR